MDINREYLKKVLRLLSGSVTLDDAVVYPPLWYKSFEVTADGASATWNTVASHEIATVTGAVEIMVICNAIATLTSGGAATLCLGVEGATNAAIADTVFSTIATDTFWHGTTPAKYFAKATTPNFNTNEMDVGYEIKGAAVTGGSIKFTILWRPLESGATVVAGAGGTL